MGSLALWFTNSMSCNKLYTGMCFLLVLVVLMEKLQKWRQGVVKLSF